MCKYYWTEGVILYRTMACSRNYTMQLKDCAIHCTNNKLNEYGGTSWNVSKPIYI